MSILVLSVCCCVHLCCLLLLQNIHRCWLPGAGGVLSYPTFRKQKNLKGKELIGIGSYLPAPILEVHMS